MKRNGGCANRGSYRKMRLAFELRKELDRMSPGAFAEEILSLIRKGRPDARNASILSLDICTFRHRENVKDIYDWGTEPTANG